MSFKIIHSSNCMPFSYPCDLNSVFVGGQCAQLYTVGNNIVCGVSDGTAPLGIIDDVRTTAFYSPAIDETGIVDAVGVLGPDGKYRSVTDITSLLDNSNIMSNSFVCDIPVLLREKNGAIIIPAGTELNYDRDEDGVLDSIKYICSYMYQVPGIPGDDSVTASGKITVWSGRLIFETDAFEASQRYSLNAPIFCNESGYLTTRQVLNTNPCIGMCVGPPSSRFSSIQVMLF